MEEEISNNSTVNFNSTSTFVYGTAQTNTAMPNANPCLAENTYKKTDKTIIRES